MSTQPSKNAKLLALRTKALRLVQRIEKTVGIDTSLPMTNRTNVRTRVRKTGKRAPPRARVPRPPARTPHIADCTKHYAAALADPWNAPAGACVPSFYTVPSVKLKWLQSGTLTCGTAADFGYIIPALCGPQNGLTAVEVTGSTFTGTSTTVFNYADTGVAETSLSGLNPTYTIGTSEPEVSWKLVACGVRIQYIGAEVNRGGRVYAFTLPNNASPQNGWTIDEAISLPDTRVEKVDREWHNWTWFPQDEHNYYSGNSFYMQNNGFGASVQGCGGLIVRGPNVSGTPAVFAYQLAYHWEIPMAGGIATASHGDPVGFQKVLESRSRHQVNLRHPTPGSILRDVAGSLYSGVTAIMDSPLASGLIDMGSMALGLPPVASMARSIGDFGPRRNQSNRATRMMIRDVD